MKNILLSIPFIFLCQLSYALDAFLLPGESKEFEVSVFSTFTLCYSSYDLDIREKPGFVSFTTNDVFCRSVKNPFTGLTRHSHIINFNLEVPDNVTPGQYTFFVDMEFSFFGGAPTSRTFEVNLVVCAPSDKPARPTGEIQLCQNSANSVYSTSGASGTTIYAWNLSPEDAGTIEGDSTTATVDWADSFSGTVQITVTGENGCGAGISSEALNVIVGAEPEKASVPIGDSQLCQDPGTKIYTTASVIGASSYEWQLSPTEAGSISGNSTTATVNWSDIYTGNATISVRAQSGCGLGPLCPGCKYSGKTWARENAFR